METLPVPRAPTPSDYERRALREIQRWKQPPLGWFGRTVDRVNRSLRDVTDLIRKVPGVDWTIENVVSGLLRVTNEIVQDSVWREAIYQEYRAAGHAVEGLEDLRRLDLEHVDAALKGLDTKYRALAATQGAAAGAAGAAGILPDVVGLVALTLRAAGEYATYCGYDIAQPSERLFALQLLNAASQRADDGPETTALVLASDASHGVARYHTIQTVESLTLSRAIRALGIRLTRAKLANLVPMAGAFISGGFNAYYTGKVCDAAFYLYRERRLIEKYGPEILDGAWG